MSTSPAPLCLLRSLYNTGHAPDNGVFILHHGSRPIDRMRRTVALLAAAASFAALSYTGYWHIGAERLRATVDGHAAMRRTQGLRTDLTDITVDGFPMWFRVSAGPVVLEHTDNGATGSWAAAEVVAEARPWRPSRITVRVAGRQTMSLHGFTNRPTVNVATEDTTITLAIASGQIRRLGARITGVRLETPALAGTLGIGTLRLDGTIAEAEVLGPAALRIVADLSEISLPLPPGFPLGSTIRAMELDARVTPSLPSAPDLAGLAAWRRDGGAVEVDRLNLTWGALAADAAGTFALDEMDRPLAALTARVRGHRETIDALVGAGMLSPAEGAATKLALSVLAGNGANGAIEIPLTVQNGWLSAGALRILRLPSIRTLWPSAG
jgi:hypothetical protein